MAKTKTTKRKSLPGSGSSSGLGDQKCTFCPKTFATKDERNKHLVECAESRLFCEFCHFNTNKLAYLRKHIRKIHCSAEYDSAEESGQDIQSDAESVIDEQKKPDENNNEEVVTSGEKTEKATEVITIADEKADKSTDRTGNINSLSLFDDISSDDDLGEIEDSVKVIEEADKTEVGNRIIPEIQTQAEEKSPSLLEGRVFSKKTRPTPVVTGKRGKYIPLKYQKRITKKRPISSTPIRKKTALKKVMKDSSVNSSAASGPLDNQKPSTSGESLVSTKEANVVMTPDVDEEPSTRQEGGLMSTNETNVMVTPVVPNSVAVDSRGTQTDNVLVTKYMEVVTTYREGGRKIKITEWKERM